MSQRLSFIPGRKFSCLQFPRWPLAHVSSLDPMVTGYNHSLYTAGSQSHPRFCSICQNGNSSLNPDPSCSCLRTQSRWSGLISFHHESRGASAQPPPCGSWTCSLSATFSSNFQTLLPTSPSDETLILHLWEKQKQSEKNFYRFQSIHVPVSPLLYPRTSVPTSSHRWIIWAPLSQALHLCPRFLPS